MNEQPRRANQPSALAPVPAAIALGTNLEPRLLALQAARRRIFELHAGYGPILCSKVYETAPIDCPEGSPPFLNAVMEISLELDPRTLLQTLKEIEAQLGRTPSPEKNSPRIIDLDILYCGDFQINEPGLKIPHPQMTQRAFVLKPLADLHPQLVLPGTQRTVREALAGVSLEGISVYCNTIY